MNSIELLAPAKDLETGLVAVNAGADAVYIGAPRFGARQAVGNSLRDIEKLVNYAHKYWARVYATVNTLLYDDELEEAVQLCHRLYRAGVDALIIQDVGLLESDLPPVPLFASTQMHNHTPERVAFLEQVGLRRVILARELSLEQIAAIRAATTIELETFIHGALCVCYSGQCALSYAIGDRHDNSGRSGNRGQCAQPCRRAYSLIDRHGNTQVPSRHLLSLKDLNLTDYLRDLIAAGVCSFKIEGRLKDQAYVKNVVAHYRLRLDAILPDQGMQASSAGRVKLDFEPDPNKTFNRGYTSYFLTGQRDEIASPETPKHAGEPIGVVTALGMNAFMLNVTAPLNNGDGLTFFDRDGQLQGTLVNRVDGVTVFPAKMDGLYVGAQIRRNADHEFLRQLGKSQPERKIPLRMKFSETEDGFWLSAGDPEGNSVVIPLKWEKVPAQKAEQARATLERQLTRLGESDFKCDELKIELSQPSFLPVSTLNALRRELVEKLAEERRRNFPRWQAHIKPNEVPYPQNRLTFLGNVLNQKAEAFYRRHGVQEIEPAAESGLEMQDRKVMTTKHCLKYELGSCPHQERPIRLDEPLYLVDEDDLQLRLAFNCRECVMEIYFERAGR
jgi:collagenase-like PrtC family protease